MLNELMDALRAQLSNQMVTGAVALGLVGVVVASLRKIPGMVWSQYKRTIIVTDTLDLSLIHIQMCIRDKDETAKK